MQKPANSFRYLDTLYAPDYVPQEADMGSYSAILSDGSEYVREGLVEKWQRWVILILLLVIQAFTICIIPLFNGYLVRIYGSTSNDAPNIDDYKRLFVDGWKLNIVTILYMIPAVIVGVVLGLLSIAPIMAAVLGRGRIDEILGLVAGSIGLVVTGLIFAIITLIMYMAFVHFSRSGKIIDAFSVGEITKKIGDGIGWASYVFMWVIIWIISMILCVIIMGLNVIPPLGVTVGIVLTPLWAVFIAKVTRNVYDNKL
ncbi:DUF4013 domain-containing protein [Methanospirillum lacunae]|uniref:DUF4013 domain-containing protein n=1 Tax=Methanospirillum lacunae TaxID=668570 RepID=A0A2V2N4E0_9EURY|nr:DUF4013 domain-containing protein [Methanospirillum lacunae]PWR74689.1 hypothetical protein DK846_00095 [Methanospirillum lacunae]